MGKMAHLVLLGDINHQEGPGMYSQLPDYDNSQGYYLGMGGILSQIGRANYANFRKPSWGTLKHH